MADIVFDAKVRIGEIIEKYRTQGTADDAINFKYGKINYCISFNKTKGFNNITFIVTTDRMVYNFIYPYNDNGYFDMSKLDFTTSHTLENDD